MLTVLVVTAAVWLPLGCADAHRQLPCVTLFVIWGGKPVPLL